MEGYLLDKRPVNWQAIIVQGWVGKTFRLEMAVIKLQCTQFIEEILSKLYHRTVKHTVIGPIFLQTIPIPVQAQKIWSWTGIIWKENFGTVNSLLSCMSFCDWIVIMQVFTMYNMCLIIFEEKAEMQDQYPLSLNTVQKADDPESGS